MASGSERFPPNPKILSRNELYTPLAAHDNASFTNSPSSYMASRKAVPISLRESSLYDFLHKASIDFHRSSTTQGKNNGNRPLSRKDVDDRLRQRALTLLGGGIHTLIGNEKKRKRRNKTTISNQEQKRRKKAKVENSQHQLSTNILIELNSMWNTYAQALVKAAQITENPKLGPNVKQVASIMRSAEWVGAHVHVTECLSRPHLLEKDGIVVEITQNTWKIAVAEQRKKTTTESTKGATSNSDENKDGINWKVHLVPQRGTALAVCIPKGCSKEDGNYVVTRR